MNARFVTSGSSFDMTLETEALVRVTSLNIYLHPNAVKREVHPTHRFLKAISVDILLIALRSKITCDDDILYSAELKIRNPEIILIKIVEFSGDEKVGDRV